MLKKRKSSVNQHFIVDFIPDIIFILTTFFNAPILLKCLFIYFFNHSPCFYIFSFVLIPSSFLLLFDCCLYNKWSNFDHSRVFCCQLYPPPPRLKTSKIKSKVCMQFISWGWVLNYCYFYNLLFLFYYRFVKWY